MATPPATNPFLRALDAFLPPRVASQPSQERTRARSLIMATLGVVVIGLASALIALPHGTSPQLLACGGAALGFALVPLSYRISGSYQLAAWFFVVLAMGVAGTAIPATGGLYSPFTYWLPMLPAIVLVVLDYRAAVASVFFVFGLAFVLVGAHGQGVLPPTLALDLYPSDIARVLLFSSLFFLAVSYARERALADVQAQQGAQTRARARAEAASRAKSSILASVSHELRTPMTGILGLTDLLADSHLDDDQREWVRTIHKTGNALLALLDDLLDTARLEAGRFTLKERAFRPSDLVEQVISLFRPRAKGKGLSLHLDLDANVPAKVRGDPARLRQVLINLVGNALKFTDTGGVVVRIRYDGAWFVFEITDTGVGIPEDRLTDVFAPFVRAETGAASTAGGVGLGLSIARLLVEAMQGDISVQSEVGVGTVFTVRLPLEVVEDDIPTTDIPGSHELRGPGLRVLVAEDNAVNRMVLSTMLERMGHSVRVAHNGDEVLPAARAHMPDVVFMDMRMPVVDGLEATRRLRADPRFDRIRIVALTANAFDEDRQACIDAGMDAFLTKPITRAELLAALRVTPGPTLPAPMPDKVK
ncbi:MAG: response regulator [Alphaproteobacteria bacterium]|nr:response regulator [Alphaproteobacteria bacterium]